MDEAELRDLLARLSGSVEALAAVAVLLDERAGRATGGTDITDAAGRVLGALGGVPDLAPDAAARLAAVARATVLQIAGFLADPAAGSWSVTDPEALTAQGHASAAFAPLIRDVLAPRLGDLASRLAAPGTAFLDAGVGVAALSLAMAHQWPTLRVVGLDVWEPSLAVARGAVVSAGLADRVELRHQDVADLSDEAAYDLAWLAVPFIPRSVVEASLPRLRRSLKPGGWFLFATFAGSDPFSSAVADFRTLRSGGALWPTADALAALADAGFVDAQVVPLNIGFPSRVIAAAAG